MIDNDEIVTRLVDMPLSIKGMVSPSPDGVYNIYLNARLSHDAQIETYFHELKHIYGYDFESDKCVSEIENKNKQR